MYILNGKIYDNNEKTINPLSQGFMFGYGLFETLKILEGKILFLDEHIKRLEESVKKLSLNLDMDNIALVKDAYRLMELNKVENGVLKISYVKNDDENYLLLSTRENSYSDNDYIKGFKLMFSGTKRNENSILCFLKTNNYLENLLAKDIANKRGFDECLFLNSKDFIAEGAVSNIFWVKDNVIYTPSIECGILPGVVREKVLECIKRLNICVKIGEFTKSELLDSREVFITNSVMDIMPVSLIEETRFNVDKTSVTTKIINEYNTLIGEYYEV